MAALAASAALFEVSVPEYKQLKLCRKELRLLKELWDMVTLVWAGLWEQGTLPSAASRQGLDSRLLLAGTGTWCQPAIASPRCRAVAASERAHCHQREDETRGRLSHLEQVCMVCAGVGGPLGTQDMQALRVLLLFLGRNASANLLLTVKMYPGAR